MKTGLKLLGCFAVILAILVGGNAIAGHNPVAVPSMYTSLSSMLQPVLPAIVNIRSQVKITDLSTLLKLQRQQDHSLDREKDQDTDYSDLSRLPNTYVSIASGIIVDAERGYVLTNAHVVQDAKTITVTLKDGQHYAAKLIGSDLPSDVALLQIQAKHLTAMILSNSNELKVGDFVAAIGNPFGLSQTVTSGIVSALGRTTLGIENYENFIQTDAPINPGNSGGALINMQGQLVGMNTAILAPNHSNNIGIGFAIPSNMVKSVMTQLVQYGNVQRGVLGIGAQDMTPDLAKAFHLAKNYSQNAAIVTQVLAHSPAAKVGIQVGDIIISIDHNHIKNANDIMNAVGFVRMSSSIYIQLLRENRLMTVSATIVDPQKRQQLTAINDPFLFGVGLKNMNAFSPIHGSIQGVLVISVEEGSRAWRADVRPGDIITSANQTKIHNISELQTITKKASHLLMLNVLRGPGALFLVINQEE